MGKVVFNNCHGGFKLSEKAIKRYQELSGKPNSSYVLWYCNEPVRHDPLLVQIVEELGKEASGDCSNLQIAKIPGNKYLIVDYDGLEEVQYPEVTEGNWIVIED